ncbi:MAG: hypothetical protein J6S76_04455, partial [Clostridia bacterium]|nr:hypothetical protein [Clostridia bacterium]
ASFLAELGLFLRSKIAAASVAKVTKRGAGARKCNSPWRLRYSCYFWHFERDLYEILTGM